MNKEIEELARYIHANCLTHDTRVTEDCRAIAQDLYSANYRRQKVGRWITHPYSYECSLCEFEYELDVIAYDYNPITDFDLKFCSVCGAKMEGDSDA